MAQKLYFLALKYRGWEKEWPRALSKLKALKATKLPKGATAIDVLEKADAIKSDLAHWIISTPFELKEAITFLSELGTFAGRPSKDLVAQCALELREVVREETGELPNWTQTGKMAAAILPNSGAFKNRGRVDYNAWIKHRVTEYRKRKRLAETPKKARPSTERKSSVSPKSLAYDSFCRFLELAKRNDHTDSELAAMRPFLSELGDYDVMKGWKVVGAWGLGNSPLLIWKKLSREQRGVFTPARSRAL